MPTQECSVTECVKPAVCRTWCDKHYTRWKRTGDPVAIRRGPGTASRRFWSRVDLNGPIHPELGPCWLWLGATNGDGYGSFGANGTATVGAHRYAYQVFRGAIEETLELDHLCRVRNCVRPDHLEAVTHRVNVTRGGVADANRRRKGEKRRSLA